ncbi:MAG: hypothetical protein LLF95_07260 [Bacteroidales bacterium]|nr:hypothetical protein [Bacteroidales bacterium]
MNKQTQNTVKTLRFRRWSRARYAVFVSLSCAVSIGFLSVLVSDKSLQKSENRIGFNSASALDRSENDEQTDVIQPESVVLLLLENNIVSNQISGNAAARGLHLYIQSVTVGTGQFLFQPFFI